MSTVLIVRDVLDADGSRLPAQGMFIDAGDLELYRSYGWRLPLGAPAIPTTVADYPGFDKDPDTAEDWIFDWSQFLTSGETITASLFFAVPGITLTPQATVGAVTRVILADGVLGVTYVVTNRITTSTGRPADRSFTVRIIQQ